MPTPTTQLYPEVTDQSVLGQRLGQNVFLPIGIEGQADSGGAATTGILYQINRRDEAVTQFGTAALSELTRQIHAILDAGAGPVIAGASAKGTTPTLVQRQVIWALMESDEFIRLRLTDSTVQSDLVALATSMNNADLLNNKQLALMGMASGTTKAALLTAATAIAGATGTGPKRAALIAPGVYDSAGTLRSGSYAAACVAAEMAKHSDPSTDLDLGVVPNLTGIEKGADGLGLFRRKVVTGAAVNDFEDLLQGGVSPLMPTSVPFGTPTAQSGVQISHLRTVYITDTTFDALMTRIIVDQVFLDVKNYVVGGGFLQAGNTLETRTRIASGVTALLNERRSWITPILQGDGTLGYNVAVTSSPDNRQITISYQGTVVRGISTVQVAANLTIPA